MSAEELGRKFDRLGKLRQFGVVVLFGATYGLVATATRLILDAAF